MSRPERHTLVLPHAPIRQPHHEVPFLSKSQATSCGWRQVEASLWDRGERRGHRCAARRRHFIGHDPAGSSLWCNGDDSIRVSGAAHSVSVREASCRSTEPAHHSVAARNCRARDGVRGRPRCDILRDRDTPVARRSRARRCWCWGRGTERRAFRDDFVRHHAPGHRPAFGNSLDGETHCLSVALDGVHPPVRGRTAGFTDRRRDSIPGTE